jgi:hypothetical protein
MKTTAVVLGIVLVMLAIDFLAPVVSPVVGPFLILVILGSVIYVIADTVKNK